MNLNFTSGREMSKDSFRTFMNIMKIFIAALVVFLGQGVRSFAQVDHAPVNVASQTVPGGAVKPSIQTNTGNVTVNFKDVDIKTVLHYLSEVSGVDIIPTPGVEAPVTMRLRNKPWEVALDIVTRNYGFAYSRDYEQGIIRVMPKSHLNQEAPVTAVLPLNNLMREIELRKVSSSGSDQEVEVRQGEESIQKLMSAIHSMLDSSRGENATFIPSVSSLVVTAVPAKMGEIKQMVEAIDKKTPQIVLDIKVLEIGLNTDERFGVDWNAVITAAGSKRAVTFPFTSSGILSFLPSEQRSYYPTGDLATDPQGFPLMDNTTALDPIGTTLSDDDFFSYGTLDFSTFTATLSLLDNRGDTEVISSPKITTLNNQKAQIKVVDKLMLQKSIESTEAARTVTVEFDSEEDAREAGVKLTVIPHVNETGDISVNLLPEVSTNNGFLPLTVGVSGSPTVALSFSSREANTIIRVRDGETIFLGGLIRKSVSITENKFPILGDILGPIPIIGNAFKYDAENVTRTELVFFVTVYLVKDGTESIEDTGTIETYNKYKQTGYIRDNNRPPVVNKGIITETTEEVELNVKAEPKSESDKIVEELDADKKEVREYKPWFDFSKKKEK